MTGNLGGKIGRVGVSEWSGVDLAAASLGQQIDVNFWNAQVVHHPGLLVRDTCGQLQSALSRSSRGELLTKVVVFECRLRHFNVYN